MTALDSEELALLRSSLERTLAAVDHDGATTALDRLGWPDLYQTDPHTAVAELFEIQGRLVLTSHALDFVMADAMGLMCTSVASSPVVVHPSMRNWDIPPGTVMGPEIEVEGLVIGDISRSDSVIVPCRSVSGELLMAEVDFSRLECDLRGGIDPTLRLAWVHGRSAATSEKAALDWEALCATARRALGHEMLGLIDESLGRTISHVSDRVQFGRPIASFQSVRHRLTEVYVAHAATKGALDAAWATGDVLAADAAKALAGRAGALAGKHCLQVTGAIGFSWEYGLHHMMRRLAILDALYGSATELQARIGACLLETCLVPRIHPLA